MEQTNTRFLETTLATPHTPGGQGSVYDASMRTLGLSIARHEPPDGGTTYTVKGGAHALRAMLQDLGGDWDGFARAWIFKGDDPSSAICERVASEHAAVGLSDSMSQVDLSGLSYESDHRQRLRDRFLADTDGSLPDCELLELALFFSIPTMETKFVATELLTRFGTLSGVVNASAEQLAEFKLMDHFVVTQFKLLLVMATRLARADLTERPLLDNWDKLITYLRITMAHRMVEHFRVLYLDRCNMLITDEVQHGSIAHTPVYPREVVKRALALDASAVVMVHNHPSNRPQPSQPDIEMTRIVRDALHGVGVVLHDHLIIARRGHVSFRQMGLLEEPHRRRSTDSQGVGMDSFDTGDETMSPADFGSLVWLSQPAKNRRTRPWCGFRKFRLH